MIDPAGIIEVVPNSSTQILKLNYIPDCDTEVYDIYDEKSFKDLIKDVEKEVRKSFEYKRYINYLRDYVDMNKCAFIEGVEQDGTVNIKIERHHYPFTLYDICIIVFNKRLYYKEPLDLEMIAREVTELHYKMMVGLIPLSTTVHQLVHNKYVFIPVDKVYGRYKAFVDSYKEFMLPEHIDVLQRIEEYSSSFLYKNTNNAVLQESKIFLETQGTYKLPDLSGVTDAMFNRIQEIKSNGYRLPALTDNTEPHISNKQKHNVIYFFN